MAVWLVYFLLIFVSIGGVMNTESELFARIFSTMIEGLLPLFLATFIAGAWGQKLMVDGIKDP